MEYEIVNYKDLQIKFIKSKYFNDFSKFSKLFSLFGRTKVLELLIEFEYIFSEDFIKSLFNKYDVNFYINSDKEFIFAYLSPYFEDNFGELTLISGIDALERYGIDILEEATEKGHTEIY